MTDRPALPASIATELDRHWIRLTLIAWVVIAAFYITQRWAAIHWLSLGDTDDNMRLMQVRALLNGQGWYDLRNYRLNPPGGFDIHWSRLVDLPIAALILLLRPFVGMAEAEKLACGIAPLIPLSVTMIGLGATVRRLVDPLAWPLAIVFLMGSTVALLMFMPERIDHHGWQLAMLSLTVAGLCDPKQARGGAIVGLASAASLTIGLELLPYAAMAGAIIALRWIWDRADAQRLTVYALALAGGSAAGFAVFASNANRVMRCDALTPVWLSVVVGAGALLFVIARLSPEKRAVRLALAMAAGAAIAIGFALLFPQCLGRPEQVSDELYRNWLSNVREAKPIYKHAFRVGFPLIALPVMGLIGAVLATRRASGTAEQVGWACVTLFAAFAVAMLLWQVRAGPAAQLMAIPGVTALGWIVLPWLLRHPSMPVRVFGTVAAFVVISGIFAGLALRWLPIDKPKPYVQRVNRATGRCVTVPALNPLNRLPAQTIFTFVDLGPRLITLTHHNAIAGPYHRNGDAILDVQHAFKGSPEEARAIIKRHGATLLLVCPNMAESTNYRAKAPGGFYARLAKNEQFGWLTPVPLPKNSPLRAWRID
ncbi:AcrB/AcrD/AcrF family protein [Sphingomonas sp. SUN019]|uniref:AcrB/AcrD/AcrF family protein n=1 Tax=Sphingomonas sp. SUN019 TaxID=2937788 RepID=UPI002164956C|nr:AcrB/AcrD/AcrF family protein [Sphingomonas sp. SUN019]UVO50798.1 AcrB/AcrD/AcrF family protein [Sphingomonas sp. SUN019]